MVASGVISTWKRPPAMPSVCMRVVMSLASTRPAVARRAESCCCERAIALERRRLFLAKRGEIRVRALHLVELRFELRRALRQFFRRQAVLARQLFDGGEPPLHLILPRRIHVQAFDVVLQLLRRFADLNGRFVDQRQHRAELRIDRCKSAQRLQGAAHARVRAAFLALVELHRVPSAPLRRAARDWRAARALR